jgi:uncharacterized protein YfaP (DUF2135 family)
MKRYMLSFILLSLVHLYASAVTVVSGESLAVNGHYIHYDDSEGESAFNWLYVLPDGSAVYKLQSVTDDGYLSWADLTDSFSSVEVSADGRSVTFNALQTEQCTGTSSLSGTVSTPNSTEGLSGSTVVLHGDCGTLQASTDSNGNFIFSNIAQGNYTLGVTNNGYLDVSANWNVTQGSNTFGLITAVPTNYSNILLDGKIINAATGEGVSGAIIQFHSGYYSPDGTVVKSTVSDSDGKYALSMAAGYYTVEVSKDGFTSLSNISLSLYDENELDEELHMEKDFAITPVLNNNSLRIVLQWGSSPYDLDSHLAKMVNDSREYHIYYNADSYASDSESAVLDVDDTNSYGPETITIENLSSAATYKYYVHDYSNIDSQNSNALAYSEATVSIYQGSNRLYKVNVPNLNGTVWKVFEIVNGVVVPCNGVCMFYTSDVDSNDFGTRSKETKNNNIHLINGESLLFIDKKKY